MLDEVWKAEDGRYVSDESVRRCWRKANVLPATWNADIINDVGSASLAQKDKQVSAEACDELCNLMEQVKLKADESGVDAAGKARVFEKSFVSDGNLSHTDFELMRDVWIDAEDDPLVVDALVEEELEKVDSMEVDDDKEEAEESKDDEASSSSLQKQEKVTHMDVTEAIDTVRQYLTSNNLPREYLFSLGRLQGPYKRSD